MNSLRIFLAITVAALLLGCGPPKNARVVRPGEMKDPKLFTEPFWIAFEKGDELPVHVDVEGAIFELKSPPELTLKIHKRVFVLIGDGPPKLSYDRETFLDGGGSFSLGIGNSKDRGPQVNVVVRHQPGSD